MIIRVNYKNILKKIGITGDNFIEEGNKKISDYLRLKNMEDIFTNNSLESLIADVNPEIKEISDLSNLEKLSLLENLEDWITKRSSFK